MSRILLLLTLLSSGCTSHTTKTAFELPPAITAEPYLMPYITEINEDEISDESQECIVKLEDIDEYQQLYH